MSQTIKENWGEEDIPSQNGKTVFITGASNGLGFEAARMLAGKGAQVLLGCRKKALGDAACAAIRAIHPDAKVESFSLDLADLETVANVPRLLGNFSIEKINTLINNAGIMMPPKRQVTEQGFEAQFGTNHLGHFALTRTLLPFLAPDARIVNVASIADRRGAINWEDLQWEEAYSPQAAYGQSKTANLLFTKSLTTRFATAGSQMTATAAHPGISRTNLGAGSIIGKWLWLIRPLLALGFGPKTQTSAMGALPEVYAATCDVEPGAYYGPSERTRGYPIRAEAHRAAHSDDADAAERLWTLSEELTGGRFGIATA